MPASRRRKIRKKAATGAVVKMPSAGERVSALWKNASVAQKRGAMLVAVLLSGGAVATFAIRTARLPAVCYKSASPLPAKTSIFSGLYDGGNQLSASESLMLIQQGLNTELARVQNLDVGTLFDRNGKMVGRFQGVSAALQSSVPAPTLPTQYRLTINGKEVDIHPGDEFSVSTTGVSIGEHRFKITDVVLFQSIPGAHGASAAIVPEGRIMYHLIGKDKRYTCE